MSHIHNAGDIIDTFVGQVKVLGYLYYHYNQTVDGYPLGLESIIFTKKKPLPNTGWEYALHELYPVEGDGEGDFVTTSSPDLGCMSPLEVYDIENHEDITY